MVELWDWKLPEFTFTAMTVWMKSQIQDPDMWCRIRARPYSAAGYGPRARMLREVGAEWVRASGSDPDRWPTDSSGCARAAVLVG